MKVRRYYVRDMREGMELIRREMGSEAVIVSTRRVRSSGLKGFFQPRKLEITAAVEGGGGTATEGQNSISNLKKEISSLRSMLQEFIVSQRKPEALSQGNKILEDWKRFLSAHDLDQGLLEKLFKEIRETLSTEVQITPEIAEMILKKKIRPFLMLAPEKQARCQVFIGPTGVGKTTTLAKLAARYAYEHGEKVGLITIDHYRIGAIEQLRTYAEIADLPLEVVFNPRDFDEAIKRLSHCDRILIDTAGRGVKNSLQIGELASYISNFAAEKFLVLSALTKQRDLKLITDNFRCLRYNRLIYTKLDETNSFGIFVNGCYYSNMPVVYITNGQSVPDDIEVADREKMITLLMGAEGNGGSG
ncbi:MAG: hypothetical protein ACOYBM_00965 [Dethiobacteria bacterium]|jgi:flagellar biosynthesis protein FlhF